MSDSDLERTEEASSRRIERAREEGQVPQSRELTAFLVLLAGTAGLWGLSGWISQHAQGIVRGGLTFGREMAFDQQAMLNLLAALSSDALTLLAPLFLATIVAAIAGSFMIGGFVFSPNALALNFERLDPMNGIKKLFSVQGLGELVKAVMKVILIGGILYWSLSHREDSVFAMLAQPLDEGLQSFFNLIFSTAVTLLLGMAVITALDVPFQRWRYFHGLRMTKEELKQEAKESDGDPRVKSRIRSMQLEAVRKRMMNAVPKADVVVTNPTHFAVALKYDTDAMAAPQVVAKGMNLVAARIRELAEENDVPIIEAPPLARALYRHTDLGAQVPAALYRAVAEVMAYVYQLNAFIADGGRSLIPPIFPEALEVPAGMDPGAVE